MGEINDRNNECNKHNNTDDKEGTFITSGEGSRVDVIFGSTSGGVGKWPCVSSQ